MVWDSGGSADIGFGPAFVRIAVRVGRSRMGGIQCLEMECTRALLVSDVHVLRGPQLPRGLTLTGSKVVAGRAVSQQRWAGVALNLTIRARLNGRAKGSIISRKCIISG